MAGVTTVALIGFAPQAANAAPPTGPSTTGLTGVRPSATALPFTISDRVSASVDVATGNLLVATSGLTLPGVTGQVQIGATYNSQGWETGSTSSAAANGWAYGLDAAGSLSSVSSGVVFTGADGSTWLFTPTSGSTTAYTSPAGLKEVLVKTTSGWTLTDLTSRQVTTFDTNGNPTAVADRNGNSTAINYTSGQPTSVVSTAGPTAARTATLAYNSSTGTLSATQTNGSASRTVQYVKNSSSNITSFVDADGKTTTFAYTSGKLTQIVAPTGGETDITYDSSGKVSEVDQHNTTAGSPGTSTTRLTYPSSSQTLVAGPDTATATAVATGAHTTYTINSTQKLVSTVVDAAGRSRSATYTANSDVATSTTGTGSTAGTTTNTYGANSGQSITKQQAPGGASDSATYGTSTSTAYLPATTTDSAGNTSTLTYNGAGNQLTSTSGSGADAATATLTYNSNGTVATALAPGNGSNKTVYNYNSTAQLSSITPVTGTSLGTKSYTYDAFGHLATATDGAGRTQTYTYDNDDRLLTTAYSDSTPTVTNTYDGNGNLLSTVSQAGTETNTYDQLGHELSTRNTAGGGTESYTYDKAGNEVTSTDSFGTYTNTFDASGVLTATTYPAGSGTQAIHYATDGNGRRTDTWLNANADNSTWGVHDQTSYDTSGRISGIKTYTGTGNSDNNLVGDGQYCYNSASTTSCSTATATDRSQLQWVKDLISGQLTTYTYDTAGRLTRAAQSGGDDGNVTQAYTYDARGNRLTAIETGDSTFTQTQTFNAANETTNSGWTYDGAGNRTATDAASFTYNAAEQMTGSNLRGTTSTYTYAGGAQNELLSETTAGGDTTTSVYGKNDPQGQPEITQYATGSNSGHVFSDPVTGQPLLLTSSRGTNSLYLYDGLGNPAAVIASDPNATTPATYSYDPFGLYVLTSSEDGAPEVAENPYTFKGGVTDRATGLVKFGARFYDDYYGTWTQEDTLDSPSTPAMPTGTRTLGMTRLMVTTQRGSSGVRSSAIMRKSPQQPKALLQLSAAPRGFLYHSELVLVSARAVWLCLSQSNAEAPIERLLRGLPNATVYPAPCNCSSSTRGARAHKSVRG